MSIIILSSSSEGAEPRGAAAPAAGGEDLQGVHGQAGGHRVHPLRPPGGVRRLRSQPAPLPHLQGRDPGQRPGLHVLSPRSRWPRKAFSRTRVSNTRPAGSYWPAESFYVAPDGLNDM